MPGTALTRNDGLVVKFVATTAGDHRGSCSYRCGCPWGEPPALRLIPVLTSTYSVGAEEVCTPDPQIGSYALRDRRRCRKALLK